MIPGRSHHRIDYRTVTGTCEETRRIMIVDDNEDTVEVRRALFEHHGLGTLAASNGEEAVETAVQSLPNVILMNGMMPLCDGWEATRRLKADARTAHIPVIIETAAASPELRMEA